jgi:hypothetical protein
MCRVDDPLRNPNPELEKRHKRLMSYRRMWQRTWDKAYAEIQRRRDQEAELAAEEAEAAQRQASASTSGDDLRNEPKSGQLPMKPIK